MQTNVNLVSAQLCADKNILGCLEKNGSWGCTVPSSFSLGEGFFIPPITAFLRGSSLFKSIFKIDFVDVVTNDLTESNSGSNNTFTPIVVDDLAGFDKNCYGMADSLKKPIVAIDGVGGNASDVIEDDVMLGRKSDKRALSRTHAKNTTDDGVPVNPSIIGLDWLSFRLKWDLLLSDFNEDDLYSVGPFRFAYKGYGTKHYRGVASVFYNGEHWAEMCFDGNKKTHINTCQVTIKNEWFYKKGVSISGIIEELMGCTLADFLNFTRVDIAIDGENDFGSIGTAYNYGLIERLGSARFKAEGFDRGSKKWSSFYIGSRSSSRMLRVYDKTLELEQKGHKDYITQMFHDNGLHDQVYRAEMQFNSAYFREFAIDFTLRDLDNPYSLGSLFSQAVHQKGFAEFVEKGLDKNKSRWDKIPVWDCLRNLAVRVFEKAADKVSDGSKVAKMAIKRLCKEAYFALTDTKAHASYMGAAALVHNSSLLSWFREKSAYWISDFEKHTFLTGEAPAHHVHSSFEFYSLFDSVNFFLQQIQLSHEVSNENCSTVRDIFKARFGQ